jgi:hypothetical protein
MNVNNVENRFLGHLIMVIKEKMEDLPPMSKAKNEFEAGRSLAYHEVADIIVECSRLFNVSLKDLGITDFNPDKLL